MADGAPKKRSVRRGSYVCVCVCRECRESPKYAAGPETTASLSSAPWLDGLMNDKCRRAHCPQTRTVPINGWSAVARQPGRPAVRSVHTLPLFFEGFCFFSFYLSLAQWRQANRVKENMSER